MMLCDCGRGGSSKGGGDDDDKGVKRANNKLNE